MNVTCGICLENDLHPNNDFTLLSCQHGVHTPCLAMYLSHQLGDNKPLVCSFVECQKPIDLSEVSDLLTPQQIELWQKVEDRREALRSGEVVGWCPDPTCSAAIKRKDICFQPNSARCPVCRMQICVGCRTQGWHSNDIPCAPPASDRPPTIRHKYRPWKIKTMKSCPKCGQWTVRNGGCHHMTCATCREDWCWLCKAHCDPTHFNDLFNYPGCYGKMFPSDNKVKYIAVRGALIAGLTVASPLIIVGGGIWLVYTTCRAIISDPDNIINNID